jgi:hypothetical protein
VGYEIRRRDRVGRDAISNGFHSILKSTLIGASMAFKEIAAKKYVVRLTAEQREQLRAVARLGGASSQRRLKARILLKADVGEGGEGWSDAQIVALLEASASMVYRVRRQLAERGLSAVLSRKPAERPPVPKIFAGDKEARLIALASSAPPAGRARWTLRLLEQKVVELNIVERASDSTIGRALNRAVSNMEAAARAARRPTSP